MITSVRARESLRRLHGARDNRGWCGGIPRTPLQPLHPVDRRHLPPSASPSPPPPTPPPPSTSPSPPPPTPPPPSASPSPPPPTPPPPSASPSPPPPRRRRSRRRAAGAGSSGHRALPSPPPKDVFDVVAAVCPQFFGGFESKADERLSIVNDFSAAVLDAPTHYVRHGFIEVLARRSNDENGFFIAYRRGPSFSGTRWRFTSVRPSPLGGRAWRCRG